VPEQALLADLQRIARHARSDFVTTTAYERLGRFNVTTVLKRFGSWNAGLKAAGLAIRNVRNVPDDELFENFAEVWRKLGRQPVAYELVKRDGLSRFSTTTYQRRFGTWNKALQAFATFIDSGTDGQAAGIERDEDPAPVDAGPAGKRREPRRLNWRLRAMVLIRDNCLCRMCGASPAKDPAVTLHVDHIEPWSKGGRTTLANLQTLCSTCNIGKADCMPPQSPKAHHRRRRKKADSARLRRLPQNGPGPAL
jgi:hypothetical protein